MFRDNNKSLHQLVIDKDHIAVRNELINTVQGGDIHPQLNQLINGNTPLHLAVSAGDYRMIQILFAAGPRLDILNINNKFAKELSPNLDFRKLLEDGELHVAAWHGELDKVKALIQAGKKPGETIPIRCVKGVEEIVKNITPLYCATYKNHHQIVAFLTPLINAEVYKLRDFGLFEAIGDNDIQAVIGLIKHYKHEVNCCISGGGMQAMNYYEAGCTPLAYSIYQGRVNIVKQLIELGADIKHKAVIRNVQKSTCDDIKKLFQPPAVESKVSDIPKKDAEQVAIGNNLVVNNFETASELYHRGNFLFKQAKTQPNSNNYIEACVLFSKAKDSIKLFKAAGGVSNNANQLALIDKRLEKIKEKISVCERSFTNK